MTEQFVPVVLSNSQKVAIKDPIFHRHGAKPRHLALQELDPINGLVSFWLPVDDLESNCWF